MYINYEQKIIKIARKWYIGTVYEPKEEMERRLDVLESGGSFLDNRTTGDMFVMPVSPEQISRNILELILRLNKFRQNKELNGNTVDVFFALKVILWQIQETQKGRNDSLFDSNERKKYRSPISWDEYNLKYDCVPFPLWDSQF